MYRDRKSLEAVSYLLDKLGGTAEYIKLIKLLYLVDRKLLEKKGRTVTGDRVYALPLGPILSRTLDRLDGKDDAWSEYITNPSRYEVKLARLVPVAALSSAESDVLDEVLVEHGSKTWQELVEFTHTLPEWLDKGIGGHRTRVAIELEDIARALGFNPEEIEHLKETEREREDIAAFWSSIGIAPVYA